MDGSVLVHWNQVNRYDNTDIIAVVISKGRVGWGSVVLIIVSLRWCLVRWVGWWGRELQ